MTKSKEKITNARKAAKEETVQATLGRGLRPAPQRNVFSRISLKLVAIIFAILILGVFVFKIGKSPKSQIQIKSQAEKFHVGFQLQKTDRQKASQLLEKLQLPQNVLSGFDFILDSTSSAGLAWAAPINLDVDLKKDSVNFSGNSQVSLQSASLKSPSGYKMPKDTSLAIYAPNLQGMFLKNLKISPDLKSWLDANVKTQNGQFLTVSNSQNIFAFILSESGDSRMSEDQRTTAERPWESIPSQKPDFDALSKIQFPQSNDSAYKEETTEDITIHLVKLDQKEDKTISIFQINNYIFMATNQDAAINIIKIQKGQTDYINFPKTESNVSFALYIKENEGTNESTFESITNQTAEVQKYLKGTKEALLTINGKKITGYVNF